MTNLKRDLPDPASIVQFCRLWSAHVDTLDRHLSDSTWAPVVLALIAYPIARVLFPAVLHGIVPDVVRTVLHLI